MRQNVISVIAQGYAISFRTNLALVEFLKIVVRKPVKGSGHAVDFTCCFKSGVGVIGAPVTFANSCCLLSSSTACNFSFLIEKYLCGDGGFNAGIVVCFKYIAEVFVRKAENIAASDGVL